MKKLSNIAYTLVLAAAMTGCADYVDTSNFTVEMPESIKTYEYLDEYDALNTYVDRNAHPNFKLGVGLNGADYYNRTGLYALACSNFDMATAYSELMYGSCVSDAGNFDFEPYRKFAEAARIGGQDVFGHALTSSTNQNVTWMRTILSNAISNLGEDQKIVDMDVDYSKLTEFPFNKIGSYLPVVTDGVLECKSVKKFYLVEGVNVSPEFTYDFTIDISANKKQSVTLRFGDTSLKITLEVGWQTVTFSLPVEGDASALILDPGPVKIDVSVKRVQMKHQRALTEAEKLNVYKEELERWISGIMEKSKGVIKIWDLTNEPIANSGDDGQGYYPLITAPVGSKTEFYWQDCLGDIQFIKIAYDLANQYYKEFEGEGELSFFVNESCLDDVKKAESLIHWIGKWEAAGVKISGIGTKMHVKCSLDANQQTAVKEKISNNLRTLAASGKEVLISELEAVLVDDSGAALSATGLSLDNQKALGEFYAWVFKTYFEIVPQAQQAGIILWAPTDGDNPTGLWSSDLKRVPAFAGVAEALQGK